LARWSGRSRRWVHADQPAARARADPAGEQFAVPADDPQVHQPAHLRIEDLPEYHQLNLAQREYIDELAGPPRGQQYPDLIDRGASGRPSGSRWS
jgi:hypothetical protein